MREALLSADLDGDATPVLWVRVGREALAAADLDCEQPHTVFLELGGVIGCTADAVPASIISPGYRVGRQSAIAAYTPPASQ